MKAVEAGLGILGESGRTATFYFIESTTGLKRNQVPGNPEVLVEALRTVFHLGSRELLRSILKALRDEEVRLKRDRATIRKFADSIEAGLRSIESGVL